MKNPGSRPERLALFAAVICAGLFVIAFILHLYPNLNLQMPPGMLGARMFLPIWIASLAATLVGVVSWGRCYFLRRAKDEEIGLAEHLRQEGRADLFDDSDEAVQLAKRASNSYAKYFVAIFTVATGIGLSMVAWLILRKFGAIGPDSLKTIYKESMVTMGTLSTVAAVIALIAGGYYTGASREASQRWLRPVGGWLFFISLFYGISAAAIGLQAAYPDSRLIDIRTTKFLLILLLVAGIEMLIGFIIELYRPRSPGEEERPLFESRLFSLFTEPGGLAKNLAESLDYQFGFHVSDAWFYRAMERTLLPCLAFMIISMWLLTCIVQVNPDEQGLRQNFGFIGKKPLEPGLYFKWPAPFGRIIKYPVRSIQEVVVKGDFKGGHHEEKGENHEINETLALWSKAHAHEEEPFIVPGQSGDSMGNNSQTQSFIAAMTQIRYRVKDFHQFVCGNRNASVLFKDLAYQEVTYGLLHSDFNTLLGPEMEKVAADIRQQLQLSADQEQLGIEVLFVNIEGLHPPVALGPAFENVLDERIRKDVKILQAQIGVVRMQPEIEYCKVVLGQDPKVYPNMRRRLANAENALAVDQRRSFETCPALFKLNYYLETFENSLQGTRKYVIATDQVSKEELHFDLQEKFRATMEDLNPNAVEFGSGK
jgi:regulator of protease activity HflC (stomatin/prohibitin superfamily)